MRRTATGGSRSSSAPRSKRRPGSSGGARIDLSLTERGLLDLDVVFVAAATLSFAVGLAFGRLWTLLAPIALTAAAYFGVERSWWGGGFVDGWRTAFAIHTFAGITLAAGGVLVHRVAAARAGERLEVPGWAVPAATLGSAALAIGGFWYLHTRPPDVAGLRASGPVYYLGESFEELRLTHAQARPGGAFFAYGGCDTRIGIDPGGCSVPLQLQNVTCPGQRTAVAIFSWGRGLSLRAARALRPVDADARCPGLA